MNHSLSHRKLCYSGNIYFFTIPVNTKSTWYETKFRLLYRQEPIISFKFEEVSDDYKAYPQEIIVNCIKVGRYETLRIPLFLIKKLWGDLHLDRGKNDTFYKLQYTLYPKVAEFIQLTDTEVEEYIKKIKQIDLKDRPASSSKRSKHKTLQEVITQKIKYIALPHPEFKSELHIVAISPKTHSPLDRSLCRSNINIKIDPIQIELWKKIIGFNFCKTCEELYENLDT